MIEKYTFEIKDCDTYNHVTIKIVAENEDSAMDKLGVIINNAKEVFTILYPQKCIELNINNRLIKKESVLNSINYRQFVKNLLVGNIDVDAKIYPYIVFNVDNNLCYYTFTVSYDCELKLNQFYITDDGIMGQKFKDYILLKELFNPYRGVKHEKIHI